jgi:hypothetical protein
MSTPKLDDPEQRDRKEVAAREAHARGEQHDGQQAAHADGVPEQGERGRPCLVDDDARGDHGGAHEDAGRRGGGDGPAAYRVSSLVSEVGPSGDPSRW